MVEDHREWERMHIQKSACDRYHVRQILDGPLRGWYDVWYRLTDTVIGYYEQLSAAATMAQIISGATKVQTLEQLKNFYIPGTTGGEKIITPTHIEGPSVSKMVRDFRKAMEGRNGT